MRRLPVASGNMMLAHACSHALHFSASHVSSEAIQGMFGRGGAASDAAEAPRSAAEVIRPGWRLCATGAGSTRRSVLGHNHVFSRTAVDLRARSGAPLLKRSGRKYAPGQPDHYGPMPARGLGLSLMHFSRDRSKDHAYPKAETLNPEPYVGFRA